MINYYHDTQYNNFVFEYTPYPNNKINGGVYKTWKYFILFSKDQVKISKNSYLNNRLKKDKTLVFPITNNKIVWQDPYFVHETAKDQILEFHRLHKLKVFL